MENRRSFFIRDLIVRVLLIVLFIFLLMFLFPMPNLTPIYNRIFNDNVQTMKEAAEDYFTKERMPEKEGDSSKLTLQQMLDKKLVLPFLDKNGKECDLEKSYVTKRLVFKLDDHYYVFEYDYSYYWDDDGPIDRELKEVHPVERTITVYE
jgi:hypothetical protein